MFEIIKFITKKTFVYGLGGFLASASGFLLIPIFTRYLDKSDFGLLSILLTAGSLLLIVYKLGLHQACLRYYYDYKNANEYKRYFGAILCFCIIYTFMLSVVLSLLGFFFCGRIFPDIPFYPYFFVVFWSNFFLGSATFLIENYYRATNQALKYSFFTVGFTLVSMVLSIVLIMPLKMGALGRIMAVFITNIIFFIIALYLLRWVKPNLQAKYIKPSVIFGSPLVVFYALSWIISGSGILWLNYFSGLEDVALYSLAARIGWIISFLIASVELGLIPFFYSLSREGKTDVINRLATYYAFALIFLGLFVSVFRREIIAFIAPAAYLEAYRFIPIIVLAWIFRGLYTLPVSAICYKEKTQYLPVINAATAGISVILNLILIPLYGIMGAAQAFLLTNMTWFFIVFVYSLKIYRLDYEYGRIIRLAALAILLFFFSTSMFDFRSIWLSLSSKSFLITFYPVGLYILRFYKADELRRGRWLINRVIYGNK